MGIANIINTSTSSGGGGGEIIRELVNSSDGQGLYFSNTGYIHLANNAAVEFGTSDFSIEFILNQTGEAGTSGGSIYQSATTVNNKFSIENHVSSNVVKLIFFNAVGAASQYDLSYNMAADYNEPTHYVVSCDRSGNAVLYRNGTEVASVSIATAASINLGDGVTSTAMIGNSGSGYTFLGGLYRFRTWNKALTHDEIDTCFQRADVPFESQYGSETSLVDANASTFVGSSTYGWVKYGNNTIANTSNQLVVTYVDNSQGAYNYLKDSTDLTTNLTVGKKYKVKIDAKYAGGSAGAYLQVYDGANYIDASVLTTSLTTYYIEFTAQHATNVLVKVRDLSASNVITIDNFYVYTCGVLTDHDLAFANPTQSAMCQDRAGNSDGTMGGTIQQTQPIVQLNAVAARIGTTAATPADGALMVQGDGTFGDGTGNAKINIDGDSAAAKGAYVSFKKDGSQTGAVGHRSSLLGGTSSNLILYTSTGDIDFYNGGTRMSINSTGNVHIGTGTLASVGSGPTLGLTGTAPEITLRDSAAGTPYSIVRTNDNGDLVLESDRGDDAANSKVDFWVDGASRATIDSAGNVTQAGGKFVLQDGSGANVGEISTVGTNNLTISSTQTDHCGLSFATNAILPCTQSIVNNNTVDLGANGNAFKDLYLGGAANISGLASLASGIYFSGQTGTSATGASTTTSVLNHYEVGTFTVTLGGAIPATVANVTGYYTRTGNIVNVCYYSGSFTSDGSAASITGLPFTVNASAYGGFFCYHNTYVPTADTGYFSVNTTTGYFTASNTTASAASANASGRYLMFTGTYKV